MTINEIITKYQVGVSNDRTMLCPHKSIMKNASDLAFLKANKPEIIAVLAHRQDEAYAARKAENIAMWTDGLKAAKEKLAVCTDPWETDKLAAEAEQCRRELARLGAPVKADKVDALTAAMDDANSDL